MTTDIEASLSVSFDLSSAIEEAVRSAVCSVLGQLQRLIGRDVAELRAAVAKKECENEKLRAQLDLARRELRERFNCKKRSRISSDVPHCNEHEAEHESYHHDVHCNTDEDQNSLSLGHNSSLWSQPWDSDTGSDLQHNFIDPLGSVESKHDFSPAVDYRLEAAESGKPYFVSVYMSARRNADSYNSMVFKFFSPRLSAEQIIHLMHVRLLTVSFAF